MLSRKCAVASLAVLQTPLTPPDRFALPDWTPGAPPGRHLPPFAQADFRGVLGGKRGEWRAGPGGPGPGRHHAPVGVRKRLREQPHADLAVSVSGERSVAAGEAVQRGGGAGCRSDSRSVIRHRIRGVSRRPQMPDYAALIRPADYPITDVHPDAVA